jgi:hypothetical protein
MADLVRGLRAEIRWVRGLRGYDVYQDIDLFRADIAVETKYGRSLQLGYEWKGAPERSFVSEQAADGAWALIARQDRIDRKLAWVREHRP